MTVSGTSSVSGLGSGLDIDGIVSSLMTIEAQSQNKLKISLGKHTAKVSTYQTLNTTFNSLKTTSQDLSLGLNWKVNKATSSSANVVATASSSAVPGNFKFSVQSLATAQTLASSNTVASLDTVITNGGRLINGNTSALGLSNLASSTLAAGSHSFEVTQASKGGTQKGNALASDAITIGSGQTLALKVNGTTQNIALTAGTYTRAQLATMVTTQSDGSINATLNADNSLQLTTTQEGSTSNLQVMAANSALGMPTAAVNQGQNGIVKIDGVTNTVSSAKAGQAFTLNGASGATVSGTFSSGLRVGTSTVNVTDTGTGTLSEVVAKINAANSGYTAAAVQVSPGAYRLQLQATNTGDAGKITADLSQFNAVLGGFTTVEEASDAVIKIGSGAGAYTVTSSSNKMTDVLSGVTLDLKTADPLTQVTINVAGDSDAMAAKVQALLDGANNALTYIKNNSKYDAATKTGGPLQGNSMARRLQQQIVDAVSSSVPGAALNSGYAVGITMSADGTFALDKTKFAAAYAADPEKVAKLFVEGGTNGTSTGANPGIAERLKSVVKSATDAVGGLITTALAGENSTITDLNKQIADWDTRLTKRQETLKRQYAAMDTLIAGFKSKGDWLTGQIAGLSTSS